MQIKNEKNLTLLLILLLGVIVLAGVVLVMNHEKRSKPIVQPMIEKKTKQVDAKKVQEEKTKPEQQAGEKSEEGKLLLKWTNLDEVGFRVLHPADFPVTKRPTNDRFLSIAAYDFERMNKQKWNATFLSEIRISDKSSIKNGVNQCPERAKDIDCTEQELSASEIYNDLFWAFKNKKSFQNYNWVTLGQHDFFINEQSSNEDRGIVRTYTTFIGDKKIDILAIRYEVGAESQLDDLISQMVIQKK